MLSVSCTTRAPRKTESDGKWYNFVSEAEFQQMVARGEFLEYAQVFGKNWYGTPRKSLDEARAQKKDLVLEIDVQGALQVKQKLPGAVAIFVLPPSRAESGTAHPDARPGFGRRNRAAARAGAAGNVELQQLRFRRSSMTISSARDRKCRRSRLARAAEWLGTKSGFAKFEVLWRLILLWLFQECHPIASSRTSSSWRAAPGS